MPYSGLVRRSIALLLIAPLLWFTWGRSPAPKRPHGHHPQLEIVATPLPPEKVLRRYLGPFRMEGAWQVRSTNARVYGYSSLVAQPQGQLLAISDAGAALSFSPPGSPQKEPYARWVGFEGKHRAKALQDSESTAYDPATGQYWLGLEGQNQIVRVNSRLKETARVTPRSMAKWGRNTGAEALARLHDGRFVAIREVTPSWSEARLHDALLFSGDPIEHPHADLFRLDVPDNFSVVDMTLLPDGRALILLRRFLWPMPMRFAGRIIIADTARIRPGQTWHSIPLASLASVLPVDNFEAIAAVPQPDGRIVVWIMSDDNNMRLLQRTLLWKLSVDPKQLPWPK